VIPRGTGIDEYTLAILTKKRAVPPCRTALFSFFLENEVMRN